MILEKRTNLSKFFRRYRRKEVILKNSTAQILDKNIIFTATAGEVVRSKRAFFIETATKNKLVIFAPHSLLKMLENKIKVIDTGLKAPYIKVGSFVSIHFPMRVKIVKTTLFVGNVLGQKIVLCFKISPKVTLTLKDKSLTGTSSDYEQLANLFGRLQNFKKHIFARTLDNRKFIDGFYLDPEYRQKIQVKMITRDVDSQK